MKLLTEVEKIVGWKRTKLQLRHFPSSLCDIGKTQKGLLFTGSLLHYILHS